MNRLLWIASAIVLSLACLAGCGPKGGPTATVYGKVTLDGQPLAEGTISFNALDGNTPTTGGKITNGSYSVKVPRGVQKVLVSAAIIESSQRAYEDDPNSPLKHKYKETLPGKYTNPFETPLSVDVNSGSVNQDFALSSMP